jgi:uncharacterized protein with von Willebrand factor type A (vWA) domain
MSTQLADHQPARIAVAFARVLRGAGLDVPVSAVVSFGEALGVVGLAARHDVYWSGRATLARRPDDVATYDRAFAVFFDFASGDIEASTPDDPLSVTLAIDDDSTSDDDLPSGSDQEDTIELRFSAVEVLRHKDFAEYSDVELLESRQLMARLRFAGAPRRSRRRRRSREEVYPDVRATVRAALSTGGEAVVRRYRAPSQRPRRLVLLLDVSGSMEPYARALIRFVHAAVAGRQRVEAFALGTRLTRLTRELSGRDPDRAVARAADQVIDWSGGTRLGDGLAQFNDLWGQRGLAHGAQVVILSDGWDRGDPEVLAEQMRRLHRIAHQVVWVNPLKVTPGYAPLARGMAAALPYVDAFVEGHSIEAMEQLTAVISNGGDRVA